MVGSVIDGEDVLQDALIKAVESFPTAGAIGNPEAWLYGSRTIPRWISCAAASVRKHCGRARTWT